MDEERVPSAAPGKRRLPEDDDDSHDGSGASKRLRSAVASSSSALVVHGSDAPGGAAIVAASSAGGLLGGRTSSLEAPIMHLTGHKAAVYAARFSPDGRHIATAGKDRDVLLWNVFGEGDNYALLRGHKAAVLELAWSADGGHVFSASADKTVAMWDAHAGAKVRTFAGHERIVNSVSASASAAHPQVVATACDDGGVRLYDVRAKQPAASFTERFPQLAVAAVADGSGAFAAGVDGVVRLWDARKGGVALALAGHGDIVTGLALSPDGGRLLSFGMDAALRAWDVRPFCPAPDRCVRVLTGAANSFEQAALKPGWSGDGERVGVGSAADRMVYVWEVDTGRLEYRLPGHSGEWGKGGGGEGREGGSGGMPEGAPRTNGRYHR